MLGFAKGVELKQKKALVFQVLVFNLEIQYSCCLVAKPRLTLLRPHGL